MKTVKSFLGYFKFVFLLCLVLVIIMLVTGRRTWIGPALIAMFGSLALYCMSHAFLKSFAFTVWVFAFVAASMVYPSAFMTWLGVDLKILIVPLIQIIMFGMGTTLSVADFGRVFKMPWPVFVGFVLQFSVMPLTGLVLAKVFGFQAEVAAGVVLIGSCPGGVASNLMTYLAGGNVALSVTMTSCSTLLSPFMTPFLMKVLAGQFVPIDFVAMMLSIANMIISPVLAGLIANRVLYSSRRMFNRHVSLAIIIGAIFSLMLGAMRYYNHCVSLCVTLAARIIYRFTEAPIPEEYLTRIMFVLSGLKNGFVVGLLLIGLIALTKLIISLLLGRSGNWMDKALPIVSMAGICYIIAIITARSADMLMSVGPYLIAAAILHNFIGYVYGYWGSRGVFLDEKTSRTVAIEVGLQNGGMASGLAMAVFNEYTALAPAIFGPWMNVSGSVLATWWRRKPAKEPIKGTAIVYKRRMSRLPYFVNVMVFLLLNLVFLILAVFIGNVDSLATQLLTALLAIMLLLLLILFIRCSVMRLHDLGKSGWNVLRLLIPFVGILIPFYLLLTPSVQQAEAGRGDAPVGEST